jgi:hypothetical protein
MYGGLIAAVVGAAAVVVIVFFLWHSVRRGHEVGNQGLVQRSRLTCPKCQQAFDFDFVPGASVSALRLGTGRYMACPLCHKWSYFDLYESRVARTAPGPPVA